MGWVGQLAKMAKGGGDTAIVTKTDIVEPAVSPNVSFAKPEPAGMDLLERAKAMEGAGEDIRDIHAETGWARDRSGQFKHGLDRPPEPEPITLAPIRADDLGFTTTAERALFDPPPRFRDARNLTAAQWRKYFTEAGAGNEAFEFMIEPALATFAKTGDISKADMIKAVRAQRPNTQSYRQTVDDQTYQTQTDTRTPSGPYETNYSAYVSPGPHSNYQQELILMPQAAEGYKSHNWSTEGVVGHIRTTDRVTTKGVSVRFVDELQSDLHQEGAKYGYKGEGDRVEDLRKQYRVAQEEYQLARDRWQAYAKDLGMTQDQMDHAEFLNTERLDAKGKELHREWSGKTDALNRAGSAVREGARAESLAPPRAPVQDWEKPFIRRVLQQAIENDQELVAFTDYRTLNNALQNEGTEKFYDQRLPAHIRKVAKELGAQVERIELKDTSRLVWAQADAYGDNKVIVSKTGAPGTVPKEVARFDSFEEASAFMRENPVPGTPVLAIRITPEAKKKLSGGNALFASPFVIAAGAGLGGEAEAQEAPDLPRGFVDSPSNPTFEQFQATTVPGMEAAPEQVSGRETSGQVTRPDGGAVWGAAFRLENVVGSMLSREKTDFGEWEEGFNPLDPEHLEGYEDHADRFIDARTSTRMEQIKRQIDRELRDREIIARSGWGGLGAMLVAGTVDPTILIPVGGTVKKGESLLTIGVRFAVAGGAGATVSEIALQSTQETRTAEESALNIGGGVLLGGLLGTGGYALVRAKTGKPVLRFDAENEALAKRLDDEMVYDPDVDPILEPERIDSEAMAEAAGGGSPQSVGAAKTDTPDLEEFGLAPSLGLGDVTAAAKLNPVLRLSTASSAKAREAGALLMENGMFLNRNKDGGASPISVEQAMTEYRGWHAEAQRTAIDSMRAHRKAGGKLSTTEFYEAVGKAMRRSDEHADEHVTKAANAYRQAVEKTKDRAVELGLLPEDIEVKTASSYFHRMWNRRVLIRRPEDFKRMVSAYLDEQFEKMRVAAAQLEAEKASKGDFAKKAASDYDEAVLSSREAGKASRAAERKAKTLQERIARTMTKRDTLSDELLDLADGDTPPAQSVIDRMSARIAKLDEDIAANEAALKQVQDELPGLKSKADDAEGFATRMKGERDDARANAKLSDEDEKFIKDARELFDIERIEGTLENYRNDASAHVHDTLMGYDSRTLPTGITMAGRGPLKERTFNIPDLFEFDGIRAEEFLVSDAQEVMDRYMRVMSADIELTRNFGSPDMEDIFQGIKDEYDEMIAAAKTDGEKKKLRNEMDGRMSDLRGVRDVIRGNFGTPTYDNMWARGAGVVRSWNYATMLGGMTVSAFPDVANKVLSHGFMGVARDLVVPLVAGLKNVKIAAKEAKALGIAVERTLATRIATLADIGDVYGRATAFERGVGAMTNHFTKWTGMRLWNDVMKQADYVMASNRAIRAMDRPSRMSKSTRTWLAQLGIGEADYGLIMKQVRKHGETSGAMRLSHVDKWDDAAARRIWIGAMGKNANIQTVTPGAGDRLLMMHTELGKTIGQFKTFAFGANQRVTVRAAQQARMGHGRVISALTTYIGMGMLVYYLKQKGSNRTPSDEPEVWVREGIDRSGVVSVFMEALNTAEKVTGQTFVGESPSSRYASRNAFGSMLGPSFGRGVAATEAMLNLSDGELQDRDLHAVRKLLPYNNIFWLRTVFDEFEIALTEATDAEETSLSDRRESLIN